MAIEIYKRGQGKYTRITTFVSGAAIGLLLAWYVWNELMGTALQKYVYVTYAIPVVLFAGLVALMYWAVNRPSAADFMIATEGEMKKVSWSSRKEVIGGTKVVIATMLLMAAILWAVDLLFGFTFRWLGVVQIGE